MIVIFLVLWLGITPVFADIFTKPPDTSDQDSTNLQNSIQADSHGRYFKNGLDYNIYESSDSGATAYVKDNVPLGLRKFDFNASLNTLITDQDYNNARAIGQDMASLVSNPLMTYQYSSPAEADLYKHLNTMANLRMILRFAQYQDLERAINDPLVRLRKQAQLDCLNRSGSQDKMEEAFEDCTDLITSNALAGLNSISNRSAYIQDGTDIIADALDRVKRNGDDWSQIKDMIPEAQVSKDSFQITPAAKGIRQVFLENRKTWIDKFNDLLSHYKSNRTIDQSDLDGFFVAGAPLTAVQVRNLAMLPADEQTLSIAQWASQLAYLQTMDEYAKALDWLNRALEHPAIEPAYKAYIRSRASYVRGQMAELSSERGRLEDYDRSMGQVIDQADEERLKTIAQIK